jgi:hypothetical protein
MNPKSNIVFNPPFKIVFNPPSPLRNADVPIGINSPPATEPTAQSAFSLKINAPLDLLLTA